MISNNVSNNGEISGSIKTEQGISVENITTEILSDLSNYPKYGVSNNEGLYSFEALTANSDYLVNAYSNEDYLNGVSTLDLVLIQRHILGLQHFDSPYKMIAADVNNDFDITALDLINLRKLILGIYEELPENNSWKSVDSNQKLTIQNAWHYKTYLEFENLTEPINEADFISVKIGDVNNSASTKLGQKMPKNNSLSIIDLVFDKSTVEKDEEVELELISNSSELYAYQMTLAIPGFEVLGIEGYNFKNDNAGMYEDKLTLSYDGISPLGAGKILTIKLKAIASQKDISDRIKITSDITSAEAYVGEMLNVVNISDASNSNDNQLILYQNRPNPFTDYTTIEFVLPESELIKLEFFNISGQLLHEITIEGVKGNNSIELSSSELNTFNSVIYYTITSDKFISTKKMTIIR